MNNATEIEWDIDNEKVSISFKNEDKTIVSKITP